MQSNFTNPYIIHSEKKFFMKILIAKANEPIIRGFLPKVNFEESTKNTSTFRVTIKTFQTLYNEVKSRGYNPYALMTW